MFNAKIRTRDDYLSLVHPDDMPYLQRKFETARDTGEPYVGTVRVRCGPESYRVIRWSGRLTFIEGQLERIVGHILDVGPCEHDRPLPNPWYFTEAVE